VCNRTDPGRRWGVGSVREEPRRAIRSKNLNNLDYHRHDRISDSELSRGAGVISTL
jgi:hypothetical protein